MSIARKAVAWSAGILFGVWIFAHWGRLSSDQDALIRFVLGTLFAVLIILRGKGTKGNDRRLPGWSPAAALVLGVPAVVVGIIFGWHIVEWSGLLLLLFACLFWAFPKKYGPDLVIAFFILFWMHPLPGQVFGWLQNEMQRLSILGAERILQALNVRVWGDLCTMTLRTGYHDFMVPESCSGMHTSVTVFLCTIGVATLLRLRWYETVFFVVAGLVQVLVLNIVRITYMVMWAPRMPEEWAENFLHDSLGIFLMGAILLVQLESAWWQVWSRRRMRIKEGIRRQEIEPESKASILPHPLRRLIFFGSIGLAVGLVMLVLAGFVYKNRAYHRKEMIREVAEGLVKSDPESAVRAVGEALKLVPGDGGLLSLEAQIEMVRGRYDEGLAILDRKEQGGEQLTLQENALKSWALMRLDRIKEARKIVDALPPETDQYPGVAMLKAELARVDDKPDVVARYVVRASGAQVLVERIRRLFPYLAAHEQWDAIANADLDLPYSEAYQALIALYANQKSGNLAGVARVMSQAMKVWPDDPRFLPDLYRLALVRQGTEWESLFEHNLLANAGRMNVDQLAAELDHCWWIARPDLAWTIYNYLRGLDPQDPALLLAPARFGNRWFMFRCHQIEVEADSASAAVNLQPLARILRDVVPIRGLLGRVPLGDEIVKGFGSQQQKEYLSRCLAELKRRDDAGSLSVRLERMYPTVLVMDGRFDEAHARLDAMLRKHPELEAYVQMQHAQFYDRQGQWQKSYEALRDYVAHASTPNLRSRLIMIQACMNLNMSVIAMDILQKSRKVFPNSVRLNLAESAIWDVFGFKEQALHVISQTPGGDTSPVCVGLLYDTGRIQAARKLSEATGVPLPQYNPLQLLKLPSASFFMEPHWPAPLDEKARRARVDGLQKELGKSSSPFIKALQNLELEYHRNKLGNVATSGEELISKWNAAGRDDLERAGALYQLALLTARDRKYKLSEGALRRALKYMPQSQIMWRALVGVSGGDKMVVEEAWKHCSEDSEILLAKLVDLSGGKDGSGDADWSGVSNLVARVVGGNTYSPGTLVRAGEWLLERGRVELAAKLAHKAIPESRGLLAADSLGVRIALKQHDLDWANVCTISGIENARNPVPFYKVLVDIKAIGRQVDSYLVEALEFLQQKQGEDSRWAQMLGRVYFQEGDMHRSLSVFSSVLKGDTRNVDVGTLILAAEAARRNSRLDKAINILEAAYALQPDQLNVLNNLVYLLAQKPETLSRAKALMPKLIPKSDESFAVMDTIAVVYLKSGDLENARKWMEKARSEIEDDSYSAPEVRLNAARIILKEGKYKEARKAIRQLQKNNSRTDYIDQEARGLLQEIESLSDGI